MTNLGLVYQRNNQAYLGIFEDSKIYDFVELNHTDDLYDDLRPEQFKVINVLDCYDLPDMGLCALEVITTISMIDDNQKFIDVEEFLTKINKFNDSKYEALMNDWYEALQSLV